MNLPHCPHMDRLGHELIEAYRRIDDKIVFRLTGGMDTSNEVSTIHQKMADHRNSCPICQRIARIQRYGGQEASLHLAR